MGFIFATQSSDVDMKSSSENNFVQFGGSYQDESPLVISLSGDATSKAVKMGHSPNVAGKSRSRSTKSSLGKHISALIYRK